MEIYIFGAGDFGQYIYQNLIINMYKVIGYIDNDSEKIGKKLDNKKIFGLKDITIEKRRTSFFLVTVVNVTAQMDILNQLEMSNIEHVYLVSPQVWYGKANVIKNGELDNRYVTKIVRGEAGSFLPTLSYLETHVMNGCCLKCKGCSHFSNLFQDNDGVSFEKFEKDMEKLGKICNIERLRLLGGEPLLHPFFLDFLKVARRNFPYANLRVATNGLLILKLPEEVYRYMSEYNIGFDITMYQGTSRKEKDIVECLNSHKINYFLLRTKGDKFNKILTLNGNHNGAKSINSCTRKTCLILKDGELYRCPISAYVYKFNEKFGTNIKSESIFNIYEDPIEKLEEISLGKKILPVKTCEFCAEQVVEYEWDVSVNPSMFEWLVEEM